jgi:fructose-1,6-bisphosphatase/inositol monophosphatase family enzyme
MKILPIWIYPPRQMHPTWQPLLMYRMKITLHVPIQQHFPTHTIIGEEASSNVGYIAPLPHEGYTWIIDPIDGTTNFAAGLPLHCVSIGLCHHGIPVIGVVYSPPTMDDALI